MTKNFSDKLKKKNQKDVASKKTDSKAEENVRLSQLLMLKRFLMRERQRNYED